MELPGVAYALPDHDVLSRNFGRAAFTGNAENENTDLPGDIALGIDFDGMNIIKFQTGIYCALPEGLNGRTAINTLPTWWEKSGVFTVEAGNGCTISGIEGSHKLDHGFINVCADLASYCCCRQ